MSPSKHTHSPAVRSLVVALALVAAAAFADVSTARAGCGCQKAPPEPGSVRPNATYAGTEVTVFSPSFVSGATYSVEFTSGTTSASSTVTASAVRRRDLADGALKQQVAVPLPDLPLGPTGIRVRNASGTVVLSVDDAAFTVVPPPIVMPKDPGMNTYPGYTAAVARDGTLYISLDVTGITLPRVYEAQAKGYPLRFTANDTAFYNTQGFLMQLLVDKKKKPLPGMFGLPSVVPASDSDLLHYSRHEFNTYFLQHFERTPHQLDASDSNWHLDGTPHVDHNHLILAIAGKLANGSVPAPGATPPFTLALECFTLFSHGLAGASAISLSGSATTDSYAPGSLSAQPNGDVFTNGTLTMKDTATVNGAAEATSYSTGSNTRINGNRRNLTSATTFMAVKLPSGLPDLGTINLKGATKTIQGPGSFQVKDLIVDTGGLLVVDNSTGPVTLYVTGLLTFKGGSIEVSNPDPEYFAVYVTGNKDVSLSSAAGFDGVLYAPASLVAISGGGHFFGAVVAKTLQASGSARLHYDEGLRAAVAIPPGGTGAPVTVSGAIGQSSDDAEEIGPGKDASVALGMMYLTSTDLEMVADVETPSYGTQTLGLRFNGMQVPPGAIINNAAITFRAVAADTPNTNTGTTSLTIAGQAADNPTTFTTTGYNVSSRLRTAASVAWSPLPTWSTGSDYSTPDLASIAQELVNRPNWTSGNSMVFILTGTGSRSAEAFDADGGNPPRLEITYSMP